MLIKRMIKNAIISLFLALSFSTPVRATCPSDFKLLELVNWSSIYPISIAGVEIADSTDEVTTTDIISSPICVCEADPPLYIQIGLSVGFWEPARLIETVKDPGCFPSMGIEFNVTSGGGLGGTNSSAASTGSHFTSAQAHYFIYPIWSMLGMLTDWVCAESSGFDVAYMTEFDPLWQDDTLSLIINPESVLFGNPATQAACIADSIASAAGQSLSPLFWCMGSWGSAYPLTGHIGSSLYTEANAAIAARMLYKLAREMLVCDTNIDICSCKSTPIWVKHNYKMHVAVPVKDFSAHPIGRSGLLWSSAKNPPVEGDNFVWTLYRRRSCCAF
ncbi:MAG: TraU family protein [Deltaproteobacteria bacterium]|nr:TraU family protein [Deltaproteobacteria bacterium]